MNIKRIMRLLLVVLLLIPHVSVQIGHAEMENESVVIIDENFDQYEKGDQPDQFAYMEDGGRVKVVDTPNEENKSMYLEDTSSESHVALNYTFEDVSDILLVEVKFMQEKYGSSTKVIRLKGDKTPVIIETKNGAITYRTGDEYESLVEVEDGRWYVIKVEVNLEEQLANVWIDDELKLEQAPLNQETKKINFFESFTPNGGADSHYLDDLKITEQKIASSEENKDESDEEPEVEDTENNDSDENKDNGASPMQGIYEAEDATLSDAIIDNKHIGFTGTGFVDYYPNAPGGWIEWEVEVPQDGTYTLDFRYAHGGADARPAEIVVNGEVANKALAFDPTGAFTEWKYTSMTTELKAGVNRIRAIGTSANGGANIDHLRIYQEFDKIFEAEDATLEEGTVIIDNKHAGFTGDGFIDFNPNAPGSWIEFTIPMSLAGEYTLAFRYAHGGTDQRPAEITINGEVVEPSLAFDPTGAFTEWKYTEMTAKLQEGDNIIRVTGIAANGGANIDHLRIHNKNEDTENGSIPIDLTEVEKVVPGIQLKKLKELGIVIDEAFDESKAMTLIEVFSYINQIFGFVANEPYKGLYTEDTSDEEWYSYILEAAEQAGYYDGKMDVDQIATKAVVNKIFAQLGEKGIFEDSNDELTYGAWMQALDSLSNNQLASDVQIAHVQAITTNLVAITLNGYFENFEMNDLEIVTATKEFNTLSPGFKALKVDKGAKATNRFGQTVILLNSVNEWDEFAEIQQNQVDENFSGDINQAITQANHLLTWQMEHGGWTKNWDYIYTRSWDGKESRSEWVNSKGEELGTIDNDATISELLFLAKVYQETKDDKYKQSIEKGIDFLMELQYPTGGFAQVYPERGNYSDYVTFNDNAMINVLETLDLIAEKKYPFNNDLIDDVYQVKAQQSIKQGIDYILESQIEVDGKLLAWCAQHDPVTYEAREARAYEHPSISGSESIGIIRYLMARPQTKEISRAIEGALNWLDEVKLENTRYISGDPNNVYFVEDTNSTAWYRFYEIGTNRPIFSGRDGVIKHNILDIEEERRNGYAWGGHWGNQILEIASTVGDFTNKVYVRVKETESVDPFGRKLKEDDIMKIEGKLKQMEDLESTIIVAQDGSGDYANIQAAIDAIPVNNKEAITVFIKNGRYKEVVTIPNNKPFVHIIGEDAEKTIITYDNYAGRDNGVGGTLGTSGSASVYLRANDTKVENITIENSFDETIKTDGKQAVAAYVSGERMYFKQVRFIGNQDTLYTHSGTHFYTDVYIEGDVDFIFGGARIVIEDSVIHSLDRGSKSNNGYVTAASTLLDDEFGMMIMNSTFTSDAPAGTVYLGRPWPAGGNPNAIGSVLIRESELGEHIQVDGWTEMSGLKPLDARLFEYKNTGEGAVINENRRQLTDEQVAEWTIENVLLGWDPSEAEEEPDEGDTDSGEENEATDPEGEGETEPEGEGETDPEGDGETDPDGEA